MSTAKATRHEKRLLGSVAPQERTSLKQFQEELQQTAERESQARQAAHHLHHHATTTTATVTPNSPKKETIKSPRSMTKQLEDLSLHDQAGPAGTTSDELSIPKDDDDRRPLRVSLDSTVESTEQTRLNPFDYDQDRLLNPLDSSNAAIAALLARALHLRHGELSLSFGHHNLSQPTLSSLFDAPDSFPPTDDRILSSSDASTIIDTIRSIASEIKADIAVLDNPFDEQGRFGKRTREDKLTETPSATNDEATTTRWSNKGLRILVRRIAESAEDLNEVRVAVVGNVDAGKSSLLGVLTKGRLDDGRGRARVSLFRHKHEIESGRTSSVGMELLGFTSNGLEVTPEAHSALTEKSGNVGLSSDGAAIASQGGGLRKQQLSWEEISSRASKVISFSDLAGHERYLKTTLFGLTATSPDFVLLIVGANAGLIGMSKEHLSVALALSVPVVCVVTKIDSTPAHVLEQTVKQLVKILRSPGCRKSPVFVKDQGMACELASSFAQAKACPIFLVSNVTGEGLPLLKTFLNVAPIATEGQFPVEADFEFSISDVFSVPFVGAVASGTILAGTVSVGDTVLLGPDSLGAFIPTAIKSIQRKRVNVNNAEAGQSVSFALKRIKRSAIRKGMVLLAKTDVLPVAVQRFEGQVLILYHNTLISPHYQAMMHLGPIRQTVQIEEIVDKPCIRTGDRATVQFRFIKHAEFVRVGDRFLFREGRTKALGVVTKLLPTIKSGVV